MIVRKVCSLASRSVEPVTIGYTKGSLARLLNSSNPSMSSKKARIPPSSLTLSNIRSTATFNPDVV